MGSNSSNVCLAIVLIIIVIIIVLMVCSIAVNSKNNFTSIPGYTGNGTLYCPAGTYTNYSCNLTCDKNNVSVHNALNTTCCPSGLQRNNSNKCNAVIVGTFSHNIPVNKRHTNNGKACKYGVSLSPGHGTGNFCRSCVMEVLYNTSCHASMRQVNLNYNTNETYTFYRNTCTKTWLGDNHHNGTQKHQKAPQTCTANQIAPYFHNYQNVHSEWGGFGINGYAYT